MSNFPSMIEADGHLALGELEMAFSVDLLSWLCKQHVFGTITLRNALLAIRPPPTAARLADGPHQTEDGRG